MIKNPTEFLLSRLDEVYNTGPWYGTAVHELILSKEIIPVKALAIINHMTAWRQYGIDHLSGRHQRILLGTDADWPPVESPREGIIALLLKAHAQLVGCIIGFDPARWHDTPPEANNATYFQIVSGIIDHDIYHSAQIALLCKSAHLLKKAS